jgi:hypothetical protein
MSRELPSMCRRCERRFAGNRKYCSQECREAAQHDIHPSDPSPEEIRRMCCRMREAGGPAWERSHTSYPIEPVRVRVVSARQCCLASPEE